MPRAVSIVSRTDKSGRRMKRTAGREHQVVRKRRVRRAPRGGSVISRSARVSKTGLVAPAERTERPQGRETFGDSSSWSTDEPPAASIAPSSLRSPAASTGASRRDYRGVPGAPIVKCARRSRPARASQSSSSPTRTACSPGEHPRHRHRRPRRTRLRRRPRRTHRGRVPSSRALFPRRESRPARRRCLAVTSPSCVPRRIVEGFRVLVAAP